MRAAVLTISTSTARGEREDLAGPLLAKLARQAGVEVVAQDVVADERAAIEERLRAYVAGDVRFAFTTGGTGLTPDDVTPEATRAVLERDAPGFAEALRAESVRQTPMGVLQRGVSGIAGRTLIVNFPGSPRAVQQLFGVIAPALAHAAQTLAAEPGGSPGH